MAVRILGRGVSDLCLGKPALRSLPISATVGDALAALVKSGDTFISVWSCEHSTTETTDCRCVGKVCMVDVICFLCKEMNNNDNNNLSKPSSTVLRARVSDLLPKVPGLVKHLEPQCSVLEAIDSILGGAQNLVVPIKSNISNNGLNKPHSSISTLHDGREFCWLTQEDVIRFILSSIAVFSPIPTLTIKSLDIIDTDIMTIYYGDPASSALASISRSLFEQKSIGVVDDYNKLIGEISPYTLACCDVTLVAAIATLSAGDLMAYIDCGDDPPEDLVQFVKARLEEKNLGAMLELMEEFSLSSLSSFSSCSSNEEFGLRRSGGSARYCPARRSEAIVCHPWSSLVAVMIQALAHRVSYVWVVEEGDTVVGSVTFAGILKVFRNIPGVQQENTFKQ